MPALYFSKSNYSYQYIYEDPDISKSRIFINGYAHDTATLQPIFGQTFGAWDTNNRQTHTITRDQVLKKPILVSGFSRYEFYGMDWGEWLGGNTDPWFTSLDPWTFRPTWSIKLRNNLIFWQDPTGSWDDANGMYGDRYWSYDLAGPAASNRSADQAGMFHLLYEDPTVDTYVWATRIFRTTRTIGKLQISPGNAAPANYTEYFAPGVNNQTWHLGRTGDNGLVWCVQEPNYNRLTFYEFYDGNVNSYRTIYTHLTYNYYVAQFWQYPSNFLHYSNQKKVFYQGAWDTMNTGGQVRSNINRLEEKSLFFYKFVYDPVAVTITRTVVYPTYPGNGDGRKYIRMFRLDIGDWNATETVRNTMRQIWYKGHTFTVGSRKFLLYYWTAMSQWDAPFRHVFGQENTELHKGPKNVWVTFEILSNDEESLIYHSSYAWDEVKNSPAYMMPLVETGNQILVKLQNGVLTMSFNVVTGWIAHNREEWVPTSIGVDSVGRVYFGITGGGRFGYYDQLDGNYQGHNLKTGQGLFVTYNWNNPTQIKLSTTVSNVTYSGQSFLNDIYLDVYDYTGIRQEFPVKITIGGNGLTFDDGSLSRTLTSSTASSVSTQVLVTGAGRPIITANLA